ncbi:cell division cycle protein 27 homolog [Aedes aegypti]|uniref:Cell division cycle protein 27 homolog n=1 Tax=Aedes aegypti TaxID=7159 RepID=A0A6I8U0U9_AEDAE|nr:cell division cycle protein 27 homolog [Aedes aegypti]XP_021695632.1 cell division cycle protein 27 homolog [Aedes aegypti]XP_021695633.1 cell division cycle protein 27 homolog [Aedes aegypti]XP_021695634.1 cell division cycle protein 27 homolog [Aedes aegypti]
MIVQEPVQAAIWHCLNHYDYQDAIFLAERLCAEVESEESLFLLATCYYRAGQKHQAHWLLSSKSVRSTQCRFLLSKCAFDLKQYSEAEHTLINDDHLRVRHMDEVAKEFGDIGCFALELISKICQKTERANLANDASRKAVKLNPFLWQSFADLCNRGEKPDPNSVFQLTSTDVFATSQATNPAMNSSMVWFGNGTGGGTGGGGGGGTFIASDSIEQHLVSTPDQVSQCLIQNIINTPNNPPQQQAQGQNISSLANMRMGGGNLNSSGVVPEDQTPNVGGDVGTPFRKQQFKYLAAMSPSTPSFGVLPIMNSPILHDQSALIMTPSPQQLSSATGYQQQSQQQQISVQQQVGQQQQQIIAESDQQKMALSSSNKKMRGHHNLGTMGIIINRKSDTTASPMLLQQQSTNTKPNVFSQTGNQMTTPRTPNTTGAPILTSQYVRRSSRLFSNSNCSVKENTKSPQLNNKFVAPRSPPRKSKQRISKNLNSSTANLLENVERKSSTGGDGKEKIETITSSETLSEKVFINNSINSAQKMAQQVLAMKKQSADGLMTLLRELGQGYLRLQSYDCEKAIEHFSNVPPHHYNSSWVQSMIALAHHEMREYESAVNIFREIHDKEPHRLQYMEIYSTDLWHLQKDVVLSALAQDLMAQDKSSPITWCVAGNCFSAHKEHETAIKFFFRAIQVDEDFAYSYTLLGHELVMTEELEKALSMYRYALLRDSRHYNAWFGIGTIYSKQERYELAELHYRKALTINPKNSVIMVHIGAMQFFLRKSEQALRTLNAAIALDPKNPLCKFHRGSMYFSMGRYQEALNQLEELKQIVPKEAVVYYVMGKIYKKLGNVDLALMHLSWATDLGSKGANNQIKDNFDSIMRTQDGGSGTLGATRSGAAGTTGSTTEGTDGGGLEGVGLGEADIGSSSADPDYSVGGEQASSDDSTANARNESLDVFSGNLYDSDSY